MASKTVNTRIQLKSDTEAHWNLSALERDGGTKTTGTTFVPLAGELIIYSPDNGSPAYCRLKVGDGVHSVPQLEFIDAGTINGYTYNGDNIIFGATARQFPRAGATDKLYVALDTQSIYCFLNNGGLYKKLPNITWETKEIKAVKKWDAGKMTILKFEDNKLSAENGVAPELETEDVTVTINLSYPGESTITPSQGDD